MSHTAAHSLRSGRRSHRAQKVDFSTNVMSSPNRIPDIDGWRNAQHPCRRLHLSSSRKRKGAMLRLLIFLVGIALVTLQQVAATTVANRGAIRNLYAPRAVSLDVIPRSIPQDLSSGRRRKRSEIPSSTLLPSDSLRLSIELPALSPPTISKQSASSDSLNASHSPENSDGPRRVHLHLKPDEHFFHPDAKISIIGPDGAVQSTRSLHSDSYRLYDGEVIDDGYTEARLLEDQLAEGSGVAYGHGSEEYRGVRGWASIQVVQAPEDSVEAPFSESKSTEPLLFQGSIHFDGQLWHVLPKEVYEASRQASDPSIHDVSEQGNMVMFAEGDFDSPSEHFVSSGCAHDQLDYNTDPSHPVLRHRLGRHAARGSRDPWSALLPDDRYHSQFGKRDDISSPTGSPSTNYVNTIGQTAGCPTELRTIYMGVAADCNYVRRYGGAENATTRIINNWNSISALYRNTFNISVGIVDLRIMNETCPTSPSTDIPWNLACDSSTTLNDRLSLFSEWRGWQSDQAGLWHLMTACTTNSEVGVAWLGTLCQSDTQNQGVSFVSGTGVSTASVSEWSLSSHEIGHNFGLIHDCTTGCSLSGACCPLSSTECNAGGQFIMNPTTSPSETKFSPCSIGNLCSLQGSRSVNLTCLVQPGAQRTVTLGQCGNGIVEEGEDCDPGQGNSSPCCDSSTCKFTSGSKCDPSNSACCTQSCQFANNGTLCRPSVDSTCDPAEFCTGTSATCPTDVHAADGTSCGNNGLACASGQCTSLDRQCALGGASMQLTSACRQRDSTSCMLTCQSPGSASQCLVLNSPLLDGSPCGYGGRCYNATCQAGSVGATVGSWYRQNLQIAIPITVVAGLIVLAILFGLVRCWFRGSRRAAAPKVLVRPREQSVDSGQSNAPMVQGYAHGPIAHTNQINPAWAPPRAPATYESVPPPPPARRGRSQANWVDDTMYNGPNFRG